LMQEIELRLERSLDEEHHLADLLEFGFGRQIAGLMLAIGCVMKEVGSTRPTQRQRDELSNPRVFRALVEAINKWLETIDPATQLREEAELRRILDEGPPDADTSLLIAAVVAAGLIEPEESGIDLGPLARRWCHCAFERGAWSPAVAPRISTVKSPANVDSNLSAKARPLEIELPGSLRRGSMPEPNRKRAREQVSKALFYLCIERDARSDRDAWNSVQLRLGERDRE